MKWNEPPQMDAGAPEPEVKSIGNKLLCAYRCSNPDFPGWDSGKSPNYRGFDEYFAILEFKDVDSFELGLPNDESLHEHPLYKEGVDFYGFYKLPHSKEHQHWVVTFHDETLQVIAKDALVSHKRVDARTADEALNIVVETHNNFEETNTNPRAD